MNINTQEINGFLIETFNQHNLEEGKKQGTCPLCSFKRKPKNQKLKCASYDWETGLGTCHNCNKTFQLHTYKRKGLSNKDYILPKFPEKYKEPESKVVKWFLGKGESLTLPFQDAVHFFTVQMILVRNKRSQILSLIFNCRIS